jgi:hypothetical protein
MGPGEFDPDKPDPIASLIWHVRRSREREGALSGWRGRGEDGRWSAERTNWIGGSARGRGVRARRRTEDTAAVAVRGAARRAHQLGNSCGGFLFTGTACPAHWPFLTGGLWAKQTHCHGLSFSRAFLLYLFFYKTLFSCYGSETADLSELLHFLAVINFARSSTQKMD